MIKVKICGITREEDAIAAAELGADAVGFNFYQKSPRYVDPYTAGQIARRLPPFISVVGVFVNEPTDSLCQTAAEALIDIIQFHGDEEPYVCGSFPGRTIKAIRVKPDEDIVEQVAPYKGSVSAILLDTYSEGYGGSGKKFDWEKAVKAKKFGRIILAGGLNPDNVADGIKAVEPYGVDVAGGVETEPGIKDKDLMRRFIQAAKSASEEIGGS